MIALDLGRVDARRARRVAALAASAGATVVGHRGRRTRPDAAFFAGTRQGRGDRSATLSSTEADVVIFDHALSGAQQRNLERALECRVVDRTSLILDIFAQRARSAEGKLQVELAQLQAPVDAPGRRLDPPRAPEGRHRPARPRRNAARDRPPPDRQRVKLLRRAPAPGRKQRATQRRTRAPGRSAHRLARRLHQRRQVDAVQPPDRRAGVRRRPAVRDARHDLAPRAPAGAAQTSCCPTRSASSATCRTTSSQRSARRWPRRPRPICCCTSSTPRSPNRDEQIDAVDARARARSARCRVPQILVFNKIDLAGLRAGRRARRRVVTSRRSSERTDGRRLRRARAALVERFPSSAARAPGARSVSTMRTLRAPRRE